MFMQNIIMFCTYSTEEIFKLYNNKKIKNKLKPVQNYKKIK